MKNLISLLFFCLSIIYIGTTQSLIEPIRVTEPMNLSQVRAYQTAKTFRNWGVEKLGVDSLLFDKYTGKGQKVCVCDTGKPQHSELNGRIILAENFSNDSTVFDGHGHSTHVTGIILEMAPSTEILIAKVLSNSGSGGFQGITKGIRWCIKNGANVINLSLGASIDYPPMAAVIAQAVKRGIHVVAAAGNNGSDPDKNTMGYPARDPNTIAIGSINEDFLVSWFSSSGPDGDVVAPGEDILSNWLDNKYIVLSGTSMASPFVCGMIALYLEKHNPPLTPRDIINRTADDILPPGFDNQSFNGVPATEKIYLETTRKDYAGPIDTIPPPRDTIPPTDPPIDPKPGPDPHDWTWKTWAIFGGFAAVVTGVLLILNARSKKN